jgi:hypothetical protein
MLDRDNVDMLHFADLEDRFGSDSAYAILRTLEIFEGVREDWVKNLSHEERLDNVIRLMGENIRYQTRH